MVLTYGFFLLLSSYQFHLNFSSLILGGFYGGGLAQASGAKFDRKYPTGFPPKYSQIDPQEEGKKNKYIEFLTCSNHVLYETNRNHKVIMLGELMTSERDHRENFSLRLVAFVVMTCDVERKFIV